MSLTEQNSLSGSWTTCDANVFWGEIAPTSHVLQIYESEDVILDALEGFVTTGFQSGESVVIIATDAHLCSLHRRLLLHGYDMDEMETSDQYIPLNASESLGRFIRNGWPEDELFTEFVQSILVRAKGPANRKVRAYGEMVAILWSQGNNGATVHLEHLWHRFCESQPFCLFCAYPKTGFTQNVTASIDEICSAHSRIISGEHSSTMEIVYKHTA